MNPQAHRLTTTLTALSLTIALAFAGPMFALGAEIDAADSITAHFPELGAALVAEGFDLAQVEAKVEPRLLDDLERGLEASRLEGRSTDRYRVDIRLRSLESQETRRLAFKSSAAQHQRQRQVASAQDAVFAQMHGLYGVEALELRYAYENFYGFNADADYRAVAALAGLDDVARIFLVPELEPDDIEADLLTRTLHARGVFGLSGAGVTIAVIDSGFDYTHAAFGGYSSIPNAKVVAGRDLVRNDNDPMIECADDTHGTATASVAAGGGNAIGVAPGAQLVLLKVSNTKCVQNSWVSLSNAIDWILSNHTTYGIDIVTMSMSHDRYYDGYCDSQISYQSDLEALRDAGIHFFSSASNDGHKDKIASPACSSAITSVGAVFDTDILAQLGWGSIYWRDSQGHEICRETRTSANQVTCYSNSSSFLDVLGPAECARSAAPGGGVNTCFGGTSAATPYVAGVAAMLLEHRPGLTRAEMKFLLKDYGMPTVDDNAPGVRITPRVDTLASALWVDKVVGSQLMALNHSGQGEGAVLYRVDPSGGGTFDTGVLSDDAGTGTGGDYCGSNLAFSAHDNTLYAVSCEGTGGGSAIFKIDVETGYMSDRRSMSGAVTSISSIAVRSSDGQIFGISLEGSGFGHKLVTISPDTGSVTLIGSLSGAQSKATAIDFDAAGTLYAINAIGSSGAGNYLFTINTSTAQATNVGPTIQPVTSIRFAPDGALYGMNYVSNGAGSALLRLNLRIGVATTWASLSGDRSQATTLAFVH